MSRRRREENPRNPHTRILREAWVEEAARVEVLEDRSRTVVSENDSPDVPFRYSINPYRGCQHACAYCYARPTHEYLELGAGTDFDRKIVVKRDAPDLLDARLRRPDWLGDPIVFSGVTDCYQPLEARLGITRGCLEVCRAFRNPVGILTKASLVARDVDLLADLAKDGDASVYLSIPFLDPEVARALEPGAPPAERRFETLAELHRAGIPVGISISPLIPGLNDEDLPRLLERARDAGATRAFRVLLRLPGSTRDVFFERLERDLPGRAERVRSRLREVRGGRDSDPRFGSRLHGAGAYWKALDRSFEVFSRRLGFATDREAPGPGRSFRRPPRPGETAPLPFPESDAGPR